MNSEDFYIQASKSYLCKPLPNDWRRWDWDELDEWVEEHSATSLGSAAYQIWGLIDVLAWQMLDTYNEESANECV